MLASSSGTTRASMRMPVSWMARVPMSRSMAISAPTRCSARSGGGPHDVVDGVALLGGRGKDRLLAQLGQRAPDLGLENDQQRDGNVDGELAQKPVQRIQVEDLRHADRARPAAAPRPTSTWAPRVPRKKRKM